MNRRTFFKITAGLAALASGIKAFALGQPTPKTPLDRVCVRRLVLEIQKHIQSLGNRYVFEVNDQETRECFRKAIETHLEDIKNRRGVYDYQVVCDESNNPPSNIDQGRLDGLVAIQPVKTVEWIVIDFSVIPTIKEDDFKLEGWDYVHDPLPGYEIKG